ncbi:MAG: sugar phosphate nucleotidyltransferase [Candidatus Woesearchaeota archaeon]
MKKEKIAISVDKPLLDILDSKVDGSIIRSRSQAFEIYLKKGLGSQQISTAVILLKSDHHKVALKNLKSKTLIKNQLDFFNSFGIKKILIVTQSSNHLDKINHECLHTTQDVKIIEDDSKGNANALFRVKKMLDDSNFIVSSGDVYNDFDLNKMISKHIHNDKLATMGLMTREKPSQYGNAVLDGDQIIDFQEKPRQTTSFIVNAGIYIFKPEIFELFENTASLEKDVFPRLARIKQLNGFFTYGEYHHMEE